jgi:hypothetical protein
LTIMALAMATGCGGVVAPPPPATAPALTMDSILAGHPAVVAGLAARTLYTLEYTTRRFGGDSTWGYQPNGKFNVRLRYIASSADSTRMVADYWGVCEGRPESVSCLRGEFNLLVATMTEPEAPPAE